ncbi:hypothetical protein THF5G08_180005 [Vibrio jasicida]|nr:hypothetical protein THF5G08_180005 [Vibrio jasicida]
MKRFMLHLKSYYFLSKYSYHIHVLPRLLLELIALEIRKASPHMVGITYRLKNIHANQTRF